VAEFAEICVDNSEYNACMKELGTAIYTAVRSGKLSEPFDSATVKSRVRMG